MSLLGYAAKTGTSGVANSTNPTTARTIARINGKDAVDTTTQLTSAFNGDNARSVTSIDGSAFWAAGNAANSSAGAAGVHYIPFGTAGGTALLATSGLSMRGVGIAAGQLYASGNTSGSTLVSIGTGTPTTGGQLSPMLPGLASNGTGPSPNSFVFFDRDPDVPGVDTLYVADDRAVALDAGASSGGMQKWKLTPVDGGPAVWTRVATFTLDETGNALTLTAADGGTGAFVGIRQVTGMITGTSVTLIATTAENTAGLTRIYRYVDDGTLNPKPILLGKAPAKTFFRGVTMGPSCGIDKCAGG